MNITEIIEKAKALGGDIAEKANEAEVINESLSHFKKSVQATFATTAKAFGKYISGELTHAGIGIALGQFNNALTLVNQAETDLAAAKVEMATAINDAALNNVK